MYPHLKTRSLIIKTVTALKDDLNKKAMLSKSLTSK